MLINYSHGFKIDVWKILVFFIFLMSISSQSFFAAAQKNLYTVCKTSECYKIANSLKSVLNFSIAPCDDFSSFVCGSNSNSLSEMADNVMKRTIALLEKPIIDEAKSPVDSARALYQGCVASAHLDRKTLTQSLNKELKNFGGMPLLPDSGYDSTLNWIEKLAIVYRQFPINAIIGYEIIGDLKHEAPKYISLSEIEEFGLSKNILLTESELEKKKFRNYLLLIKLVVCFVRGGNCQQEDTVDTDIKRIALFEYHLAQITTESDKKLDLKSRYKKVTIKRLMTKIPQIKWLAFMEYLFQETDVSVSDETEIVLMDEEYFIRLAKVIEDEHADTLANYIGWRVVKRMPLIHTEVFREYAIKYAPFLSIAKQVDAKQTADKCTNIVLTLFPHSIGKLYVENHFVHTDKQKIEHMVDKILHSTKNMVAENTWMDEPTREEAMKKVEHMKKFIAYPDWMAEGYILDKVEGLPEWCERSSYFNSLMRTYHYRQCRELSDIGRITRKDKWVYSAADLKSYYNPLENALYFSAGILQPPYYFTNTIDAINYGAQGFVIGHEISHGFDKIGSEFDGEGLLRNWWSATAKNGFDSHTQCFVQQYGSIVDPVTKLQLNGKSTLKENIADNSGIRRAYEAYMMTYPKDLRLPGLETISHLQLFFISYGRFSCQLFDHDMMKNMILSKDHLPGIYRILIPTRNIEAFSTAFNCPKGSPMNPEKRCDM